MQAAPHSPCSPQAWQSSHRDCCSDAHLSRACSWLGYNDPFDLSCSQDKIQGFWDITKRELGDARAELRLKDRELEEAEASRCWACRRCNTLGIKPQWFDLPP